MATKDEVHYFLQEFKTKLSVWGIVFRDDRGKNAQTLLILEISPIYREQILKELTVLDYSQGPVSDTLNKATSMWIFGKLVKAKEVYIKITMGIAGKQVLCISFHIAEHDMTYPLK